MPRTNHKKNQDQGTRRAMKLNRRKIRKIKELKYQYIHKLDRKVKTILPPQSTEVTVFEVHQYVVKNGDKIEELGEINYDLYNTLMKWIHNEFPTLKHEYAVAVAEDLDDWVRNCGNHLKDFVPEIEWEWEGYVKS